MTDTLSMIELNKTLKDVAEAFTNIAKEMHFQTQLKKIELSFTMLDSNLDEESIEQFEKVMGHIS